MEAKFRKTISRAHFAINSVKIFMEMNKNSFLKMKFFFLRRKLFKLKLSSFRDRQAFDCR